MTRTAINMPQVGQDLSSARIVAWHKQVGDVIRPGDVLATVESEKATFEVHADAAGVLVQIVVAADTEGAVFEPIAWLESQAAGNSNRSRAAVQAEPFSGRTLPEPEPSSAPAVHSHAPPAPVARRFSSPAARRVARELGVDWREVPGTGPRGRVQKADVLGAVRTENQASPSVTLAQTDYDVVPFSRIRQRTAERLTRSKQTIPHFYLSQDVDMTAAQAWRQSQNAAGGPRLTVTDLVLFATSSALAEFKRLNAHVHDDQLRIYKQVNLGLATALEDGLLVPVIPAADALTLEQLSSEVMRLAEDARRGVVAPGVPGTFTVSTLGQFGIPSFLPIINPPQCAILAVGSVQPRAVPLGDAIQVRQMMTVNLACDHRAVDGAYAAAFLNRLKTLLESEWNSSP